MRIYKAGISGADALDTQSELEAINRFAKTELTEEQVYTFSVVLCDNEVDRDFEKFSEQAICQLAKLFVGRTGIFDHDWRSVNQTARIYRTEIVKSEGVKNGLGEDYCALKGYAYIVAFIAKLSERFRIREIAYDRYGAEKIRRDLEELGAEHGFIVFPFGQGFLSMSPPSKDFYQFVMEGRIRHGRHPVLDWNMGNVIVDQDAAGNIKPNKKKSTEKIDGVVALIMGLARATIGGGVEASVYDERGLLVL